MYVCSRQQTRKELLGTQEAASMQSSRGDTHALSLFCDERHESSYFELGQAGYRPHISRKLDRLRWRLQKKPLKAQKLKVLPRYTPLKLYIRGTKSKSDVKRHEITKYDHYFNPKTP
jgi:hypothetical protein